MASRSAESSVVVVAEDPDHLEAIAQAIVGYPISIRGTATHFEDLTTEDASPDVVVLCDVPVGDGLSADIRRALPTTRVVACVGNLGRRDIRRALDQGVEGLVHLTRLESLGPTILAVRAGQIAVPRELRRRLERPELSTREKQVLSLVVMEFSNGEIARRLFLSESTIKSHLASAFRKLGVASRAEAARVIADPNEGLGTGILGITGTATEAVAPESGTADG